MWEVPSFYIYPVNARYAIIKSKSMFIATVGVGYVLCPNKVMTRNLQVPKYTLSQSSLMLRCIYKLSSSNNNNNTLCCNNHNSHSHSLHNN